MACLRLHSQPGFDKQPQLLPFRRCHPPSSSCQGHVFLIIPFDGHSPGSNVKSGRRNRFSLLRLTACGPWDTEVISRESRWSLDP